MMNRRKVNWMRIKTSIPGVYQDMVVKHIPHRLIPLVVVYSLELNIYYNKYQFYVCHGLNRYRFKDI